MWASTQAQGKCLSDAPNRSHTRTQRGCLCIPAVASSITTFTKGEKSPSGREGAPLTCINGGRKELNTEKSRAGFHRTWCWQSLGQQIQLKDGAGRDWFCGLVFSVITAAMAKAVCNRAASAASQASPRCQGRRGLSGPGSSRGTPGVRGSVCPIDRWLLRR